MPAQTVIAAHDVIQRALRFRSSRAHDLDPSSNLSSGCPAGERWQ
jgi:hypothetical protein